MFNPVLTKLKHEHEIALLKKDHEIERLKTRLERSNDDADAFMEARFAKAEARCEKEYLHDLHMQLTDRADRLKNFQQDFMKEALDKIVALAGKILPPQKAETTIVQPPTPIVTNS